MTLNGRSIWVIPLVASLALLGCNSEAPQTRPVDEPARPIASPPEGQESDAVALVESPAFATPEEAVQAWSQAYREDGADGHRRVTFDQNDLPDGQWQATLMEGYDAAAKADTVQVLETLNRDQVAAVIVRLGDRVDRVALYRDAKGWHICRSLRNWDAVKMPPEYGGIMKAAFNLGADATVKEIEWRKKLALE